MFNDLGIDPYEWFDNPLDSMPIATDDPIDYTPTSFERKDPPAELFEVPTSVTNPKPEKKIEVIETPHHKAYAVATAKYNPFSVGGSENIHDFDKDDSQYNYLKEQHRLACHMEDDYVE